MKSTSLKKSLIFLCSMTLPFHFYINHGHTDGICQFKEITDISLFNDVAIPFLHKPWSHRWNLPVQRNHWYFFVQWCCHSSFCIWSLSPCTYSMDILLLCTPLTYYSYWEPSPSTGMVPLAQGLKSQWHSADLYSAGPIYMTQTRS